MEKSNLNPNPDEYLIYIIRTLHDKISGRKNLTPKHMAQYYRLTFIIFGKLIPYTSKGNLVLLH